jgi:hypothetical protein
MSALFVDHAINGRRFKTSFLSKTHVNIEKVQE